MTHITKLVMQGFKSFVRKTEIPISPGINVVLGPNGSGKSNVSDALCFVLGRLSIKSMRAAKAKNLIFMGSKAAGPAKEAMVEISFDNSDDTFAGSPKEVKIKRIVRRNGQSIYKINGETRTRQDILTLLAQAGIDPNGFNIILQGEIQNFVKMSPDDRRKIIEEVAGISIYEMRKQKSLKELERTEGRLKEVGTILKERTTYLNNLERERQEALRFKKIQEDVKKFKKSIIYQDLAKKKKAAEKIIEDMEKKTKEARKVKKGIVELEITIKNFEDKISTINSEIQKRTGLEQERLNQEIANLRAELAGMNVRYENHEKKISQIKRQRENLKETVSKNEISIRDLRVESPTIAKKQREIEEKKKELESLEKERKKFYTTKSELKSVGDRLSDKESIFQNYTNESDFLIKQIDQIALELFDKKTNAEKVEELRHALAQKRESLESASRREIELEKLAHTKEHEISEQNKLIEKIGKMDMCPLCKNKITESHIHSINCEAKPKVKTLEEEIEKGDKELAEIQSRKGLLKKDIEDIENEIQKRVSDITKIASINDKKDQIKALQEKITKIKEEMEDLVKKKRPLEDNFDENSDVEHRYEIVRIEVQEISLRSEENVNSEISFKQRELERSKISINQLERDEGDLSDEMGEIKRVIKEREVILEKKKKEEESLIQKSKELVEYREGIQRKIRETEGGLSLRRNDLHTVETEVNNFKIDKARVDAEIESLEIEILEFPNVEIIRTNKDALQERLFKAQEIVNRIGGSVNLRSLEVYDGVKKEYEAIREKVEIINKEQAGVMKIIHEIDVRKKKAFLVTLSNVNEIFTRNFAQISTKGTVSLELENRKDPFDGGVTILVKTGHGKFFDVTSLSGGEQTMVALSLIFAIQEFRPYCFYILDEIDAALDKRNSERLAALLKKYMKKGQYIVITHNDEIITNATNLYGVSMHDGVSKVISLEL
ncbi:chromosome segregation protein SMC [Candidatus Pacearchaeota archaeon]|nr:chromosome segregation protein SMC [Candidatus Pacearchaeota archaeon]